MDDNKYIRDKNSNAVLETNLTALQKHRLQRNNLKNKDKRIIELELRLEKVETILAELIKDKN